MFRPILSLSRRRLGPSSFKLLQKAVPRSADYLSVTFGGVVTLDGDITPVTFVDDIVVVAVHLSGTCWRSGP